MSTIKFQLISDLHLETPKASPTYEDFEIQPQCKYLALLGDIGNIEDPRLFTFLEDQLRQFEIVFYLLGNHEPFRMTMPQTKTVVRDFQQRADKLHFAPGSLPGRFVFLDQTRFDLTDSTTALGCTLFSEISSEQRQSVSIFCADFLEIEDWIIDFHNAAHQSDLSWLNSQVEEISRTEPHRKIVVFTHHSPTMLEAANNPRHLEDAKEVRSAFVTNLSNQACWKSENCDFVDPKMKRRIVTNQKGYRRSELDTFDVLKVVTV
ncbi:Uncharacterized protein BP5553_01487 [Venustampulla echinocandica]|uniref:Calcineurin-like phosphoesterase domain-containing protein n=1 Tax=Venustampulla echinocandica TaxID=2656787 RepID=A0A370U161_9HELO|nr:Uncharacterized protein BP5553_01487 [Venustampulla echinocandica]RDL41508.1 Uncharacterized protein BP5553_01487 [Venustampulla echinocandica]